MYESLAATAVSYSKITDSMSPDSFKFSKIFLDERECLRDKSKIYLPMLAGISLYTYPVNHRYIYLE